MKKIKAFFFDEDFLLHRSILSGVLLILAIIIKHTQNITSIPVLLILFIPSYLIAGLSILSECFENIKEKRFFTEELLMTIATVGAFALGEFAEASAVMVLFCVGEYLEDKAADKTRGAIAALSEVMPDSARVIRDGIQLTVKPDEVRVGEVIEVHAGERIPLDGTVVSGSCDIDNSAITGEHLPVHVIETDKVLSGSVNLTGTVRIKVESVYAESTVSRIAALTEESAERKSKRERFIDRFASVYTPIMIVLAIIIAVVPSVITGDFATWLKRALIFLVISCPCALVISVPLTFFGGLGAASKKGILIKGAAYIESLCTTEAAVFDKTGTLTSGTFKVSGLYPVGISGENLLKIAAYAESDSSHPIARAIVAEYGGEIKKEHISNVTEKAGHGVSALIAGKKVTVGKPDYIKSQTDENNIDILENSGCSVICVSVDGIYRGCITVGDTARENAKDTIAKLHEMNIKTFMLTGDTKESAGRIAKEVGIDFCRSSLLPEDKSKMIKKIKAKKAGAVIMVGDGINDAPVLAEADVGFAMGALGSEAAIEAADVVLADDNLEKVPEAISVSKRTLLIAKENIIFSLAVKAVIMILGLIGIAPMWLAVFADVGVTLLAILNAMRATKA